MRCDCGVVSLFFTLYTQKEPLLTSVGKTVKFLTAFASGPHTRVYTQEPIISPLVLHCQGAWGVAEGGLLQRLEMTSSSSESCQEDSLLKAETQSICRGLLLCRQFTLLTFFPIESQHAGIRCGPSMVDCANGLVCTQSVTCLPGRLLMTDSTHLWHI